MSHLQVHLFLMTIFDVNQILLWFCDLLMEVWPLFVELVGHFLNDNVVIILLALKFLVVDSVHMSKSFLEFSNFFF